MATEASGSLNSLYQELPENTGKLAQHDKWFRQAVKAVHFEPFSVWSYPDPSGTNGGHAIEDIGMPTDISRLLKANHHKLHNVLGQIEEMMVLERIVEMMQNRDAAFPVEAHDEFTRYQVCSISYQNCILQALST
jgi:hypothetical protein